MRSLFVLALLSPFAWADDPPGTRVVRVVSVYTLADGRQVVVEETGAAADKIVADVAKAKTLSGGRAVKSTPCATCGSACVCGPNCGCDAASWLAACAAAPRVVVHPQAQQMPARMVPATSPFTIPTTPVIGVAVPSSSLSGSFRTVNTYTPVIPVAPVGGTRRGFSLTGPFGGGFRAGSECAPGG